MFSATLHSSRSLLLAFWQEDAEAQDEELPGGHRFVNAHGEGGCLNFYGWGPKLGARKLGARGSGFKLGLEAWR